MAAVSKRDDIIWIIREHWPEFEKHGVTSLALFGSAARDELTPDSDVDVLLTFSEPPGFIRYTDVLLLLQELLGREIHMGQPQLLRPEVKSGVLSEAVLVS